MSEPMSEERLSQIRFWVGRMAGDYGYQVPEPARELLTEIDRLRAELAALRELEEKG